MLESCGQVQVHDWQQLVAATQLRSLAINGASLLTDYELRLFAGELLQIEQLSLGGAVNVTNWGLHHISGMERIHRVTLGGCRQVTATGVEVLARNPSVMHIGVSDCEKCTGDSQMRQFEMIVSEHGDRGLVLVVMATARE
jgi:hypothetical protein